LCLSFLWCNRQASPRKKITVKKSVEGKESAGGAGGMKKREEADQKRSEAVIVAGPQKLQTGNQWIQFP
jgi:hypothetical protein